MENGRFLLPLSEYRSYPCGGGINFHDKRSGLGYARVGAVQKASFSCKGWKALMAAGSQDRDLGRFLSMEVSGELILLKLAKPRKR